VHLEALVRALVGGDDRSIADQRIVDAGVRHQVGLELVQIDVERAVEAQARRDRADHLRNEAVEVDKVRARDVQVATADVIHSLVIDKERAVRVLDGAVRREHGVVGLNHGRRDAGGRVHGELELRLLAVVGRQALEQQRAEARAGATAERVEDQEALEGVAVVCRSAWSLR
jgi:hypothetical protein